MRLKVKHRKAKHTTPKPMVKIEDVKNRVSLNSNLELLMMQHIKISRKHKKMSLAMKFVA